MWWAAAPRAADGGKAGTRPVRTSRAAAALLHCTTRALPFPHRLVPGETIRILSDLHFGDHASRITRLPQLRPLLDSVAHLILNGDTLDTRPGPLPAHTAECHAAVSDFFPREVAHVSLVTGNHDPDLSPLHHLDLAGGAVCVTHGDIFFDDLVPWSNDTPLIRQRLAAEFRSLPSALHHDLAQRFALVRRVAASIPQRHQAERNRLKYAIRFLADTVWPPTRVARIIQTWRHAPTLAADFVRLHRPRARFVIAGHTHRRGLWRTPDGVTVINTGAFCPPGGSYTVDLTADKLTVRDIVRCGGEFRPGETVATFPLADRARFPETEA